MKISALLLAAVALSGSAMAGPWGGAAPKEDRLDITSLPDCWQHCLNEGNKLGKPWDLNTISKKDFCEDRYQAVGYWVKYTLNECTYKTCKDKAVHNEARKWYKDMCAPFK